MAAAVAYGAFLLVLSVMLQDRYYRQKRKIKAEVKAEQAAEAVNRGTRVKPEVKPRVKKVRRAIMEDSETDEPADTWQPSASSDDEDFYDEGTAVRRAAEGASNG